MADMDILSEMIRKTALVEQQKDRKGKSLVKLCEPQAPDSIATVYNLPADALVIKIDNFPAPDRFFNGKNGECKRADYVIISAEKKCIVYIELKRSLDERKQIVSQLQGAQCVVKYCQEIGKVFWNDKKFLTGYENRFVYIVHTRVSNRRLQNFPVVKKHNTPDKAMRITSPHHLEFNKLAGLGA